MNKPTKPYKDFPLTAHNSGQWCKKIKGRLYYFGHWADWRAALDKYLAQRDDLQAGRKPRASSTAGPTVVDLVNHFLTDKETLVAEGELSKRSWLDYHKTAGRIIDVFGRDRRLSDIRPGDFAALRESYPKTWGVTTVGNEITRARVVFNYAGPNALALVDRPIAFGPLFRRPSKKAQRIARAAKPKKLFAAEEIRKMIDNAEPTLRAMILLGINAGLGNRDCAAMTFDRLRGDWLEYPRPKTGVDRRARLWPETVSAIDIAAEDRTDGPVFLTRRGRSWLPNGVRSISCPISQQTNKLLRALGAYREGLSFYALRHTFQTIGERSGDLVAVSAVMGHVDASMSGNYREEIADDRLDRVAEVVREWLFSTPGIFSDKKI